VVMVERVVEMDKQEKEKAGKEKEKRAAKMMKTVTKEKGKKAKKIKPRIQVKKRSHKEDKKPVTLKLCAKKLKTTSSIPTS